MIIINKIDYNFVQLIKERRFLKMEGFSISINKAI